MTSNPNHRSIVEGYGERMAMGRAASCAAGAATHVPAAATGEELDKRLQLVHRISREIIDNLLAAGTQTPLVQEIQAELEQMFDSRLLFEYSLLECELQVLKDTGQGPTRLAGDEAREVLDALWGITTTKVDATML